MQDSPYACYLRNGVHDPVYELHAIYINTALSSCSNAHAPLNHSPEITVGIGRVGLPERVTLQVTVIHYLRKRLSYKMSCYYNGSTMNGAWRTIFTNDHSNTYPTCANSMRGGQTNTPVGGGS